MSIEVLRVRTLSGTDLIPSRQGFCWWLTPQGPNLISAAHLISHLRSSTAALVLLPQNRTVPNRKLHDEINGTKKEIVRVFYSSLLTHLAKGLLQCMEIAE